MIHNRYGSEKSVEDYKNDFEKLKPHEKDRAIMNPGHVDEGKWEEAKKISQKSYGEIRWPFVMYMYEQLGGK